MFGLPLTSVIAIAGGLILLAYQYLPQAVAAIRAGASYVTTSGSTTAVTGDQDVLDLQAAKRLQARAIRLNCPEMKAALGVVFEHFFHGTTTP